MNMEDRKTPLLKVYKFNLHYAKQLVHDLTNERMYLPLGDGVENYPAFTLGHLVIASALIIEDLGKPYVVPEGWDRFFARKGPGDPRLPLPFEEGMPTREELLAELVKKHEAVERLIEEASDSLLNQPIEWRFDRYFPGMMDYLLFMCATHEAMHLGQLAAWRRAAGLPSALAMM